MRWGELAALTIGQVDQATGVITVDRKVIEVGGHLYIEAPKGRRHGLPHPHGTIPVLTAAVPASAGQASASMHMSPAP